MTPFSCRRAQPQESSLQCKCSRRHFKAGGPPSQGRGPVSSGGNEKTDDDCGTAVADSLRNGALSTCVLTMKTSGIKKKKKTQKQKQNKKQFWETQKS